MSSDATRLPLRRRRKRNVPAMTSLITLGLFSLVLVGSTHGAPTDKAERDYKAGKYEDALQNYREATTTQPDRNDLHRRFLRPPE